MCRVCFLVPVGSNPLFSNIRELSYSARWLVMSSTTNKFAGVTRRKELTLMSVYCLVKFPSEETHGVWPENLIRRKEGDKFAFQAKHGQKWFDCVVLKSGTFSSSLTSPMTIVFHFNGRHQRSMRYSSTGTRTGKGARQSTSLVLC